MVFILPRNPYGTKFVRIFLWIRFLNFGLDSGEEKTIHTKNLHIDFLCVLSNLCGAFGFSFLRLKFIAQVNTKTHKHTYAHFATRLITTLVHIFHLNQLLSLLLGFKFNLNILHIAFRAI